MVLYFISYTMKFMEPKNKRRWILIVLCVLVVSTSVIIIDAHYYLDENGRYLASVYISESPFAEDFKDPFFVNIVNNVTDQNMTDRQKVIALMLWTHDNVKHLSSDMPTYNLPAKEIVQRGYGWCWQSSQVFITLCQYTGYDARQITIFHTNDLWTHSVAEVYYNDSWHLFDPDHGVFYSFDDGTVASASDLREHPYLVDRVNDSMWNVFKYGNMSEFYLKKSKVKHTFKGLKSE